MNENRMKLIKMCDFIAQYASTGTYKGRFTPTHMGQQNGPTEDCSYNQWEGSLPSGTLLKLKEGQRQTDEYSIYMDDKEVKIAALSEEVIDRLISYLERVVRPLAEAKRAEAESGRAAVRAEEEQRFAKEATRMAQALSDAEAKLTW